MITTPPLWDSYVNGNDYKVQWDNALYGGPVTDGVKREYTGIKCPNSIMKDYSRVFNSDNKHGFYVFKEILQNNTWEHVEVEIETYNMTDE